MSQSAKDLFKGLNDVAPAEKSMGAIEAMKEALQTIAPGLSLQKMLSDIGQELYHKGAQGSHELSAGLFTGSAYVMYPHAGQERSADHEPSIEAMKQPEVEQTMDRDR